MSRASRLELDHRANEIYGKLTPEDQDLCRRLFLRLVQPGEGTEDTKRRVLVPRAAARRPARAEAVRELVQDPGRPRRPPDHDRGDRRDRWRGRGGP